MTKYQNISLFLLRITLGWFFFYAGATKIVNPAWSAAGYIKNAKNFVWFYQWLLDPNILPMVNFINEWGLLLLGVSLIFGILVRISSSFGIVLMLLYYFVILDFPYPNTHAFLIDEHIIYIFVLFLFIFFRAGKVYGLENWCARLPLCARFPRLRDWLG